MPHRTHSEPGAPRFQGLERFAADNLRMLSAGLAVFYLILALAHPHVLDGLAAVRMTQFAATSAILFALYTASLTFGRLLTTPHVALFTMATVVAVNGIAHLHYTADPDESKNLALSIIGAGLIFFCWRWFYAYVLLIAVSWTVVMWPFLGSDIARHYAFHLAMATLLGFLALRLRLHSFRILEQTQRQAERAETQRRIEAHHLHSEKLRSLGLMAGGIAHDFNNILVGIIGNADLAIEESPPASDARLFMTRVRDSAERAAALTKQMLDYSGKGRFAVETVSLSDIVRSDVDLLRASRSGGVRLDFDFGQGDDWINADVSQLRQVVLNLVMNAADAVDEVTGSILVSVGRRSVDEEWLRSAQVGLDAAPGLYASLTVQDNGRGMNGEVLEHAFDPFYSTKAAGRGLGLATVSGVLRAHAAIARIDTQPGGGTTVTTLFPLADSAPRAPEQAPPTEPRDVAVSRRRVAVVDDDPVALEVASDVLLRHGYDVVTASDGVEALDLVAAEQLDLLLLDVTMPRMSGAEVVTELHDHSLPIVLMTGYSDLSVDAQVHDRISALVRKPYAAEDLLSAVDRALSKTRPAAAGD